MVDPEIVHRRLREIDRRLAALREIEARGREALLREPGLQAQCERHLQLVVQSAIDIAVHILAEDSAETPEEYGASFPMLARLGVLDEDLADRLKAAAGLRNILVHAYLDVDPEKLAAHLSNLADLEQFASAVERYISRSSS